MKDRDSVNDFVMAAKERSLPATTTFTSPREEDLEKLETDPGAVMARAYDLDDQIKSADKWYQEALSLTSDQKQHKESACIYAQFVELRLKQRDRACQLEKADCSTEAQTACKSSGTASNNKK